MFVCIACCMWMCVLCCVCCACCGLCIVWCVVRGVFACVVVMVSGTDISNKIGKHFSNFRKKMNNVPLAVSRGFTLNLCIEKKTRTVTTLSVHLCSRAPPHFLAVARDCLETGQEAGNSSFSVLFIKKYYSVEWDGGA